MNSCYTSKCFCYYSIQINFTYQCREYLPLIRSFRCRLKGWRYHLVMDQLLIRTHHFFSTEEEDYWYFQNFDCEAWFDQFTLNYSVVNLNHFSIRFFTIYFYLETLRFQDLLDSIHYLCFFPGVILQSTLWDPNQLRQASSGLPFYLTRLTCTHLIAIDLIHLSAIALG